MTKRKKTELEQLAGNVRTARNRLGNKKTYENALLLQIAERNHKLYLQDKIRLIS